jgi:WD40 repeat protein
MGYLTQVAGALEHLHHQKSPVVHQNVALAHLVLTGEERVVLVGFGISSRWGTLRPPLEEAPTPASDVYSLAVTAHTLLTGAPPQPGSVPRFSGLSDAEAEGVLRALRRGLDTDPSQRPPSPSALVEEIRAGATTLMPPPSDETWATQAGREGRGSPTTTVLWPFADMRVRSRPVVVVEEEEKEEKKTPLHSVPAEGVEGDVEPESSRDRAARSSRLRGALAAVLAVLVFVTLLQVRSARADRTQMRRLQLASVAQALAARVDGELAAGRHERAALLARQADLFDRQTGARAAPEVDRALRAALTAPNFSRVVTRAKGGLWSVAVSPDGTRLAAAGSTVRLVDLRAPRARAVALSGHLGAIASVAFSPDGKTLATGGEDPTVRLWNLNSPGAEPVLLEGHTDRLTSLAFGFAGQRLATASRDGTVRLWDLGTTPPSTTVLSGHAGAVTAVAFSADGARLASGGADGQVRIWDVVPPAAVASLPAGADVAAVAFSPDGRYVATGGDDRLVRLWDLGQPEAAPRILAGHGGPVAALAFSADGATLASGSEDKTVRLWPLAGAGPVVLNGHTGPVASVAFSPSGETLVSAGADGTARLWRLGEPGAAEVLRANPDVDTAVLAGLVCQEVGRNLTSAEWRDFVGTGVAYRRTCPGLPRG